MRQARVGFGCAVAAAAIGLAGMVAAVRHEEPVVVATQGLPEVPPTGLLPPGGGSDDEAPPPGPGPAPEPPAPRDPAPHKPTPKPAPQADRQAPAEQPPPPPPPPPDEDPYANVEPRGTLRPTAKTPQPATKPTFDPAAYDLTTDLLPQEGRQAHGDAGASRVDGNVWRITVVVEGLTPNTRYSILVTRPEPSYGTPGPTPCEFTSTAEGWGTCTGEMWVAEGGQPQQVALSGGSGSPHASGGFS